MSSHIFTHFRSYFQMKFQWFCKVILCFGMSVASKNNENQWICRWKYDLKRVKMCELINYKINMMYTTGNNVGIEWEVWLRSLKTDLLRETSNFSFFPDISTTVGFPIVNEACCVYAQDHARGKELPLWYCRSTSRGSLTTFRYARTIYAPRSPRI